MQTKRIIAVLLLLIVGSGIAFGQLAGSTSRRSNENEAERTAESTKTIDELQAKFLIEGAKYFRTMRSVVLVGLVIGVLATLSTFASFSTV